jgi:hypothetical protein
MGASLKKMQEDMLCFIEDSRGKLMAGDEVNLQGLEMQVQEFCQSIGGLSDEEMREWKQPLQDLHAQVSELGELLVAQREGVVVALGAVETQKQAHRAYKASASMPPESKKEEE